MPGIVASPKDDRTACRMSRTGRVIRGRSATRPAPAAGPGSKAGSRMRPYFFSMFQSSGIGPSRTPETLARQAIGLAYWPIGI